MEHFLPVETAEYGKTPRSRTKIQYHPIGRIDTIGASHGVCLCVCVRPARGARQPQVDIYTRAAHAEWVGRSSKAPVARGMCARAPRKLLHKNSSVLICPSLNCASSRNFPWSIRKKWRGSLAERRDIPRLIGFQSFL